MTTDPRIRLLAQQASARIKALSDAHQSQIAAVYQEFQEQVAVVEGTDDSLTADVDSQVSSAKNSHSPQAHDGRS